MWRNKKYWIDFRLTEVSNKIGLTSSAQNVNVAMFTPTLELFLRHFCTLCSAQRQFNTPKRKGKKPHRITRIITCSFRIIQFNIRTTRIKVVFTTATCTVDNSISFIETPAVHFYEFMIQLEYG